MDMLKKMFIFVAISAQSCLCQQREKQTKKSPKSKWNLEEAFKNKP